MTETELQAMQARVLAQERLLKRIVPVFMRVLRKLDAKSDEFERMKADLALVKDALDRFDDHRGGPDHIPGVAA